MLERIDPDHVLEREPEDIVKSSANEFIAGSVFGIARDVISTNLRGEKINFRELGEDMIESGTNFMSYPLVKKLFGFDDNAERSISEAIIYITGMSGIATFLSSVIQTPIENKQNRGKYSYEDFGENILTGYISSIGFNLGTYFTGRMIPHPKSTGDQFLNSTCQVLAGNTCSTLTSLPYLVTRHRESIKAKDLLVFSIASIPLSVVDNAIYFVTSSAIKPLLFKPKPLPM